MLESMKTSPVLTIDHFSQIQFVFHIDSTSQYVDKLCWNNVDLTSLRPVGALGYFQYFQSVQQMRALWWK
jgi:hypothetical protein